VLFLVHYVCVCVSINTYTKKHDNVHIYMYVHIDISMCVQTHTVMVWLRPATKAPHSRPSPCRGVEENGKKQAENGGSG